MVVTNIIRISMESVHMVIFKPKVSWSLSDTEESFSIRLELVKTVENKILSQDQGTLERWEYGLGVVSAWEVHMDIKWVDAYMNEVTQRDPAWVLSFVIR